MPMARKDIVRDGEEGVYHCVNRCVRRAFLCGKDPYLGKNFDHRKVWVKERLKFLAEYFAIDVLSYSVMSNHLHIVIRNRPDISENWSGEEVAERWLRIFPKHLNLEQKRIKPSAKAVAEFTADPRRVSTRRKNLANISWFMRAVSEFIARKSNREEGIKGRFWEGRFKSKLLTDEGAVLSCMAYVDLNPVRAGIAKTPEESDFTSVQDRSVAKVGKDTLKHLKRKKREKRLSRKQVRLLNDAKLQSQADKWLTPLEDRQDAARRGALPLSLDDYLQLLDWTGRMVRKGKRGAVPEHLSPILERLDIRTDRWLATVESFDSLFVRVVGKVRDITRIAHSARKHFLKGMTASQLTFIQPAPEPSG